jgi:hypothetical protein
VKRIAQIAGFAVFVILALTLAYLSVYGIPKPCAALELDANNRQAALTMCVNAPGCEFSAKEIHAALTARDDAQVCRAKE